MKLIDGARTWRPVSAGWEFVDRGELRITLPLDDPNIGLHPDVNWSDHGNAGSLSKLMGRSPSVG
jgi:hypothetical protein